MELLLIPNPEKDKGLAVTGEVVRYLNGRGETPYLAPGLGLPDAALNVRREKPDAPDAVIVLGGDGSIIRAAHYAAKKGVPILGINLGRLGYLCELEKDEIPLLSSLLNGNYTLEKRMMLTARVFRNGEPVSEPMLALNDVILSRGVEPVLADFSLSENGERLTVYRADGLIFSTPTGSTAYSMSAGGPVIDDGLDVIAVVPVCPHTLYSRPLIFSASAVLSSENLCRGQGKMYLSVDGEKTIPLESGDTVRVERAATETALIRLNEKNKTHGFFAALNRKLKDF
ncbi:MAG: NAD(+)/NADH kinase [Lachnospiraceae bacterium]|nr:NAD(+)/NADH kinase [Lachnospiraceae bacterium]